MFEFDRRWRCCGAPVTGGGAELEDKPGSRVVG